jgi:LysR family glycine cleavage system transcriptional activator
MARILPPLLASRAFDVVARCGSIRLAAEQLAVSHTVVSRHVQNLEAALGVKLVRKAGRGLALTSEGMRLASQVRRAFDILADARAELRDGVGDALHICCGAALASRRLLVRLPELKLRLGGRDVILQPNNNRSTLSLEPVDAELIYLETPLPLGDMRSQVISRPRIVPVVSPSFKASHPDIRDATDLVRLPLLHEQSTRQWENWLSLANVENVPRLVGAQLWHGQMTLEAAKLGQGVALVSELIAADSFADGSVVEIIPSDVFLGSLYFVGPKRSWNTPALQAVREWLLEIFPPGP